MLVVCQIRAVMALSIQCTVWSLILVVIAVVIAAVVPDEVSYASFCNLVTYHTCIKTSGNTINKKFSYC